MNREMALKAGLLERGSGWKLAVPAFAIAVALVLAGYWRTVASLVWTWDHDGTYQYAFLIFPISLWIAFTLRDELRERAPAPSVWGLVGVAFLASIWYAGHALAVNLPQHFALIMLFPALVLACWGWRALRTLIFPLGYLLFAVPWGDGLVGPLQDITARFAVHALNLTGTPVLLNGREILTPSAVWMVADACSGVKFFLACGALGCLYAYLMYQRWWKRAAFVALSAVVPVIANGLRVYFTILIGETWGLKYATGTDHMIFGWQFFGTVLVLLLAVGWFFRDRLVVRPRTAMTDGTLSGRRAVIWPLALVVLVAAPLLAPSPAATPLPEHVTVAAPRVPGWGAPVTSDADWHPSFKGAAGSFQVSYPAHDGGTAIEAFHAVYVGRPRRGHNLITYGNDVYDPATSRILAGGRVALPRGGAGDIAAREMRIAGSDGSRLVWYWYCVGQRCTSSPIATKLLQAWAVARGRADESSVWALSSPITNGNRVQAHAALLGFARALLAADARQPQGPVPAAAEAAR
ncbi:MAG TPA: exosortase A [Rhodanobacteraceae bacterium]|nr:exosortase A [Rhodanobacteraceae bacterium]